MQQIRNAAEEPLLDRPLSTRSVIASLLLGTHPPRLPAALLVRWCGRFGIAEGTARVALSRMVAAGELRSGAAHYELTGGLRERQAYQEWSLAPRLTPWDGGWRSAVVTGERRNAAQRQALRDAMRRLRFAELREGVWLRPDNLPRDAGPDDAWSVADRQVEWFGGARPDEDGGALADRLFALDGWRDRGAALSDRLHDATGALADGDGDALPDAFVVGAAALQHVRSDPLLPGALLPDDWPGDELRRGYVDYQRAFVAATAAWFRS